MVQAERGLLKEGSIPRIVLDEYKAGKSRAAIRLEHRYTREQMYRAVRDLDRGGYFSEFYLEEVASWRQPKSNAEKVREQIQLGISRNAISTATGLSKRKVTKALAYLREIHEQPHQTAEETRRISSDSHMEGSIWPTIQPYAQIRMTTSEIIVAVRIVSGIELDELKVEHALRGASNSPLLRLAKRSPEERRLARFHALEGAIERENRVSLWLDAVAVLIHNRENEQLPHTRNEWMNVIAELENEGIISQEMLQWKLFKESLGDGIDVSVGLERAMIQYTRQEENQSTEATEEETHLIRSGLLHEIREGKIVFLEGELPDDVSFVKRLLEEDLLPEDLTDCPQLDEMYQKVRRPLRERFSPLLVLLFDAFRRARGQGQDVVRRYVEIGVSINEKLYDSEERTEERKFITAKVAEEQKQTSMFDPSQIETIKYGEDSLLES